MNRRNDWEGLLSIFNEDLEETGYSIDIVQPEDGFYNCEIWKDGKRVEVYAENYFEDELSDLLHDAFDYVFSKSKA
jgi:hypothetical protein